MNIASIALEIGVLILALGVLLMDLWIPAERKRQLGYLAAFGVGLILLFSFIKPPVHTSFDVTLFASTNLPAATALLLSLIHI